MFSQFRFAGILTVYGMPKGSICRSTSAMFEQFSRLFKHVSVSFFEAYGAEHRKNFFVIFLKEWFFESMFRNGFGRGLLAVMMVLKLSVAWAADENVPSMATVGSEPMNEARPFGIAACVNDEPIACDEIQKAAAELKVAPQEALNLLIEQQLLEADLKKKGGKISDMHVEAQAETMAKEHFNGNRELMRQVLRQQGQSLYGLKQELRKSMVTNALQSGQMPSRFTVSPQRITAYYEAHASDFREEARYCLKQSGFKANETVNIPREVGATEQKTTEMLTKETYLKRLLTEKTPLSEIQKQLDTFHTEAIWYQASELDPKLVRALEELSDGSQTAYLHIGDVWVTSVVVEKKGGHLKLLTDVQGMIEDRLLAESARERHQSYLQRLRERASVVIF